VASGEDGRANLAAGETGAGDESSRAGVRERLELL
jgi:hypothetical protein